jgi:hypothetical protein
MIDVRMCPSAVASLTRVVARKFSVSPINVSHCPKGRVWDAGTKTLDLAVTAPLEPPVRVWKTGAADPNGRARAILDVLKQF